jgi:Tfp pilus assembly protein PilF
MEIAHKVLDPYFEAALSELADTAAPYGRLRRCTQSVGTLTPNPIHTTGLLLARPNDMNLACVASLYSSQNLYLFQVYWINPLKIVYAFKCPADSERLSRIADSAVEEFSKQIANLQPCTQSELKDLTRLEQLPEELKYICDTVLFPMPPFPDLDYVPDGSQISKEEQEAREHALRGDQFAWREKKVRAALQEYRAALKLWPAFPKVHWRIGQLHYYARKPRYEKALAEFQETVRLAPEWSVGYKWCGEALSGLERFEEALEAYRKGVQLEPDEPWHHVSLGICLHQLGRYPEAVSAIRQGVDLEPHYGEMSARMYLADALKANDQLPEAIEQWRIVAKMEEWWDEDEGVAQEAQDFLDQFAPSSFDITTL